MLYGAKGGQIKLENTEMEYVTFGKGEKTLIIIPGLSDGLKTVKGTAIPLAVMYKLYAKEFKVYVISRKNKIEEGYSTREMARDLKRAINSLGINKAYIKGLSQGGMISQYLAIDYPELVEKLVIGVSISRPNDTIERVIKGWIRMAESDDYKQLVVDSMEKTYTDAYITKKKYRRMYPIMTKFGKPKDLSRFIIQAHACINHNAYDELDKIQCPTLVIGGDTDLVVGMNTSEEMAEKIKDSKLIIFKGLGHGAFDETPEYNQRVLEFFKKSN